MFDKFGLKPIEFDGETDSLFHEFDTTGNKHMEYLKDCGTYEDVPIKEMRQTFAEIYKGTDKPIEGDFQEDIAKM